MIRALVFLLSFLGVLAGAIVSHFTKEELKPGRKYFLLLEKALLLAISFVIVFYVGEYFLLLVLGLLAGLVFRKFYFYSGLALPLASENFLVLLSSLIFVFGLPHGTLLASNLKSKDIRKEIIISACLFFVAIATSLFLDYAPYLMFCAGALLACNIRLKKFWMFPIN